MVHTVIQIERVSATQSTLLIVIINRRWVAGWGRAEPTQVQINRGHPISPVEIRAGFVIQQLLSQRGGEVVSWVAG